MIIQSIKQRVSNYMYAVNWKSIRIAQLHVRELYQLTNPKLLPSNLNWSTQTIPDQDAHSYADASWTTILRAPCFIASWDYLPCDRPVMPLHFIIPLSSSLRRLSQYLQASTYLLCISNYELHFNLFFDVKGRVFLKIQHQISVMYPMCSNNTSYSL